MSSAISVNNLSKQYGQQYALKDVTLEVKANITTGLIGPNGAGKTTLMSLICDFIHPTTGQVRVLGHPANDVALKGRVSILPQDARFLKSLSIKKQLAMLAELQGFAPAEAHQESLRVLDLVDLRPAQNKLPEHLSHGMLKRCAIAQALIGEPELIMLDEPTAGLDPSTTDSIKAVIKNLQNQATIIISSHNLSVIEDLCQEVIILHQGQLHAHHALDQIVVKQEALTVKLADHPTAEQVAAIGQIDWIKSVKTGKPGSCLMVIYYDPDATEDVEINLLMALKQQGMTYREFTKGERLQEYMTDHF
ncbi:ABC transporter ATP-binding protein [Marinicella meishanensis]|uniref:ABC transporter ATP-binding protein n=1 Tax=Marinicella meishanensis TaxID=2873263 RepID=UPI001CBFF478|nr:ABC transporter ATP-binding protein [Marinicella sp. NBU2979]